MPPRANLGNTLIGGWKLTNPVNGNVTFLTFDSVAFLQQFPNPEDPTKVIDNFTQNFFAIDLTSDQKDELLSTVLLPNLPAYEWTVEWNDFMKTPNDTQKKALIKAKLDALVKYMMLIAEYQIT
jgi:hypothetical protein